LAIFSLQSESNSLVHSYVGLSAYLPLLSPLFEYALIRYLSGVPMLERDMDKKNGDDPAYKAYKRQVPCFVPFVGSKE
jgi:steroid 5-alpha reductase family enzyme